MTNILKYLKIIKMEKYKIPAKKTFKKSFATQLRECHWKYIEVSHPQLRQ